MEKEGKNQKAHDVWHKQFNMWATKDKVGTELICERIMVDHLSELQEDIKLWNKQHYTPPK